MSKNLQVQDIVRVIDRESYEYGEQGEVVEIKISDDPYNIGVKFLEDASIVFFRRNALRRSADWTRENKARRIFGNGYHSFYHLKKHFDPNAVCSYKGCQAKNTQRVMFNYVGSIYEVDLCDKHAKDWHGHCVESAPWE